MGGNVLHGQAKFRKMAPHWRSSPLTIVWETNSSSGQIDALEGLLRGQKPLNQVVEPLGLYGIPALSQRRFPQPAEDLYALRGHPVAKPHLFADPDAQGLHPGVDGRQVLADSPVCGMELSPRYPCWRCTGSPLPAGTESGSAVFPMRFMGNSSLRGLGGPAEIRTADGSRQPAEAGAYQNIP